METQLKSQGTDLKGIRESIDWIIANMTEYKSAKEEESVWTASENDDRQFWRDLWRQLIKEGFSRTALQRKQNLIKVYVEELGNKRVLDEDQSDGDEAIEFDIEEAALGSGSCHLQDSVESQTEDPEATDVESSSDSEDSQFSCVSHPINENATRSTPHASQACDRSLSHQKTKMSKSVYSQ